MFGMVYLMVLTAWNCLEVPLVWSHNSSMLNKEELVRNFTMAIAELEPACDVREWYKDCRDAKVSEEELDVILEDAVESEDLHEYEAKYIKDGHTQNPDPSDRN